MSLPHPSWSMRPSRARLALRRAALLPVLLVSTLLLSAFFLNAHSAWAKPKVHTVYEGQRLGSIAKRYNVTVEDLCRANGIKARDPIKPGQQLIIPGTDDGSDKTPKDTDKNTKDSGKSTKDTEGSEAPPTKPTGKAQIHIVAKGHTLAAIAGRYAVTVTALENANGITRNATLSVGQRIVVPHKTDKDGTYANKQRLAGAFDPEKKPTKEEEKAKKESPKKGSEKSWAKYEKPAWRSGYIKIRRYERVWEGYVIGPKNEVLGHASNKINFVLGATANGPHIDPKLIRLIASISDKFGGREIRIVSGYRTKSFVAASKHKQGKALDFSIPGIPNEVLRDYLRTIDGVGVGYYPNSSFLHLDVRGYNSYWIDHAGPGEAPRTKTPPKKGSEKSGNESPPEGDDDGKKRGDDEDDSHEGSHGDDEES